MILVSSFFHFALDEAAIISFFQDVADASPLPIVLYNFPGVVAGLDINSDMIDVLGRHPNIAAAKFTCGSVAKLTRVAASFLPNQCTALAGQMEWLVPALVVGGQGAIAGFANLFPRVSCDSHTQLCHMFLRRAFLLTIGRYVLSCSTCSDLER